MGRIVVLACVLALALPIAVSALTADELAAQIAALLAQMEALQQQIAQTAPSQQQGSNSTGGNPICFSGTRNLSRGMRGTDVEDLQRYLTGTGDYTYGEVTGYFGAHTEAAVQRFQARFGIVSSGTPATTGFGFVGARTRAALQRACTQPQSVSEPQLCEIGGTVLSEGTGQILYSRPFVAQNDSCQNYTQLRTCHSGILSGDSAYKEVVCLPYPPQSCTVGSAVIQNGATQVLFNTERVTGESCSAHQQNRTCTNGTLSGDASYSYTYCSDRAPQSCTLDAITLSHGTGRAFFSKASVASTETCAAVAQWRTCTDGTLSGSNNYNKAKCMVEKPPPPPPAPPTSTGGTTMVSPFGSVTAGPNGSCIVHNPYCGNTTVPHGGTAYYSCCAVGAIRLCQNGALVSGGSYYGPRYTTNCPADPGFLTLSDIRAKEDVIPIRNALDKLMQLSGIFFKWKDPSMPKERHMGVIAQEVQKVFPEAVIESGGILYVNYYSLIAPIIEALKELKQQNDSLRAEIDALKQ